MSKSRFIIKNGIQGSGVFTTVDFKKGEALFELTGEILDHPTRTSIQIGKTKHVEDSIGIHVNHNCLANAKLNRKTATFISLRDIKNGEEITFNYNENEDVLANPFICQCCGKKIVGKKLSSIKTPV